MQETFVGRLRGACAVLPGSHVLVAVSGGADSTALLCFFCEIRETYPISVSCAHVEHGIRGAASEEDMRFVKALCEQKNVPFYGGRVDAPGYARAHGCGLEEAARALRYDFLERTAEAVGADAIALAHHRGDQAETVLLHAARGSDIRGLCAMRWRRGKLIRPLLDAEPEALRAYLRRIGQPWREDETNACEDYARNRIRRSAMPALEAAYPDAQGALARLAASAQRDEDYFAKQLDELGFGTPLKLVNGACLPREKLEGLHPALAGRALVGLIERADGLAAAGRSAGAGRDEPLRGRSGRDRRAVCRHPPRGASCRRNAAQPVGGDRNAVWHVHRPPSRTGGDGRRRTQPDRRRRPIGGRGDCAVAKWRGDDAVRGEKPGADEEAAGRRGACAAQKRAGAQKRRKHIAMDAGRSSG